MRTIVIIVPSLQRLSLTIDGRCPSDGYVIVTPSLKYLKVEDCRETSSYLIEHMPELEEADIVVDQNPEKLLVSITSVKCLSLCVFMNRNDEVICLNLSTIISLSKLNMLRFHLCSLCIIMVLSLISLKV